MIYKVDASSGKLLGDLNFNKPCALNGIYSDDLNGRVYLFGEKEEGLFSVFVLKEDDELVKLVDIVTEDGSMFNMVSILDGRIAVTKLGHLYEIATKLHVGHVGKSILGLSW